jgi:hypothetical protein
MINELLKVHGECVVINLWLITNYICVRRSGIKSLGFDYEKSGRNKGGTK